MSSNTELQVWVVVKVESGVATAVGVYPNEKTAMTSAETMRFSLSAESDELQIFGPFDVQTTSREIREFA